jgi:nucleoside-diphosphate kinase
MASHVGVTTPPEEEVMIEQTLVVLKPDVAERSLIGAVLGVFEAAHLKIIGLDMRMVKSEFVATHYPDSLAETLGKKSERAGEKVNDYVAQGMRVLTWNRTYLTRGPVIALILEGEDAVKKTRAITGYTDPVDAGKGTIRGDFGVDSILKANLENRAVENLIHASGSVEEAKGEIGLWFGSPDYRCALI